MDHPHSKTAAPKAVGEKSMKSIAVTSVVFGLVFAGALAGISVRATHDPLASEAKEVVRLTMGLMTTMTGLVLGMLVSSAKSSYDARKNEVAEMSTQIVVIDRLLAGYGPETAEIRVQFRQLVEVGIERIWPRQGLQPFDLKPTDHGQTLVEQIQLLEPKNNGQTSTIAQVTPLILTLRQTQWRMFLKTEQRAIPLPLLIVVVSWLSAIFFSFGLFAAPNAIVLTTFAVGAIGVSSAIFIIRGMYTPFAGALKISPAPILKALGEM
jgi:hypothetical protein